MSQHEIHRADPVHRRLMLWLSTATILVTGTALWALHHWLQSLALTRPELLMQWLPRLLFGVSLLIAAGAVLGGRHLHALATRIESGKRWPPQDLRTSSDVKVLYLSAAVAQAKQFRITAYGLWGMAALVLTWGLVVLFS